MGVGAENGEVNVDAGATLDVIAADVADELGTAVDGVVIVAFVVEETAVEVVVEELIASVAEM